MPWGTGENERVQGVGHGNQINGMKATDELLYTCGIDDTIKQVDLVSNEYAGPEVKLGSQPRGLDIVENTLVTVTVKQVTYGINR